MAGSAPDRGSGGGSSAKPGKGGRGKGGSSKSSSKGSPQKVPAKEWSALLAFKPEALPLLELVARLQVG